MNIVARHWAFFMCLPDSEIDPEEEENDFCVISSFGAPTEDERPAITLPLDEIVSLKRRRSSLPRAPTAIEHPPIACGIVKNIQLVGVFPTCRWLADVTMPPDVKELFGGSPFFALGDYRVANLDVLDAAGTLHPLVIIVNTGVEGLLTGYWGAAFGRIKPYPCWARFETTGTHQTTVKEERYDCSNSSTSDRPLFKEFDCLSFIEEYFEKGLAPVTCTTQLERIIGIAAEFLLDLEWCEWLPDRLIEKRDASSKLERKGRALNATLRATRQPTVDDAEEISSPRKWSKE